MLIIKTGNGDPLIVPSCWKSAMGRCVGMRIARTRRLPPIGDVRQQQFANPVHGGFALRDLDIDPLAMNQTAIERGQ